MNNRMILSAATAITMLMGSCSKDNGTVDPDVGTNGQAGMTYQMKAVNASHSTNQKITGNGLMRWTSGYANPRQIKFEAKQKNTEIEYKSTNTSRIDLFAPVASSFGGFTLPPGTYKEIELKVKLDEDGSDPALYLAGDYTNNSIIIPLVFRVDEDLEIKTELKDVTIDNTSSIAAITELDLASFTKGVTDAMIANAQLTNGVLLISRNSNKSLYNLILSNLSGKRHKCEYKKHH